MRCPDQSAVKRIGPGVIWTLDRRAMATRLLTQPSSSMAANVVKSMHCALLIAHHDKALTCYLLNKEIARPGELALVPHANPVLGKDLRLFLRENFRRNKVTLRQRPCASGKAFGGLAEDRRYRWSRRLHPACSHVASARVNGDDVLEPSRSSRFAMTLLLIVIPSRGDGEGCQSNVRHYFRAETRHLGGSFGSLTMKRFSLILLQHCLVKPIPVVEIV